MARKFHQGKYKIANPEKYAGDVNKIVFRSSWEKKLMVNLDHDPNIISWGSETFHVPYFSQVDGKMRRYFPDFIVKYKDKQGNIKVDIIEVKPYKETIPAKKGGGRNSKQRFVNESLTFQRNTDKWNACTAFAHKHGMEFKLMTEYELGIKKRK